MNNNNNSANKKNLNNNQKVWKQPKYYTTNRSSDKKHNYTTKILITLLQSRLSTSVLQDFLHQFWRVIVADDVESTSSYYDG